jgi:hypothetical protein
VRVENELAESDFNSAVVTRLHFFELKQQTVFMKTQARLTAMYTAVAWHTGKLPDDESTDDYVPEME